MGKKKSATEALLSQKLLPLYYHESAEVSIKILQSLYKAGIRTVEYTNRGEAALGNYKQLRKAADKSMQDLQLGVGTIKTRKAAKKFIDAGADFIVCPSVHPEVAEISHAKGLLWVPGCLTTTEIATAEEAGATIVKIFPGSILGPSYITAIREIFPSLQFMPTGGVEPEASNLRGWFSAGVVAVGMGSRLISKGLVQERNFEELTRQTEEALQLVKNASAL
jgi:2-dehydro-3-deoxyphosphogluconate aldolase/(4S)-4-hydroxy-2-oxoglutarate aldolase